MGGAFRGNGEAHENSKSPHPMTKGLTYVGRLSQRIMTWMVWGMVEGEQKGVLFGTV